MAATVSRRFDAKIERIGPQEPLLRATTEVNQLEKAIARNGRKAHNPN
jgi:hypothetical protein